MKKFYVFLSALVVVASASALEKHVVKNHEKISATPEKVVTKLSREDVSARAASKMETSAVRKSATRADEPFNVYYRAADDVMAMGWTENSYAYSNPIGFASQYGNVVFNNFSSGASTISWKYSEVGGRNADGTFNTITSDATDLTVESGYGVLMTPELTGSKNLLTKSTFTAPASVYYCGVSANFWGGQDPDGGDSGLTYYQNCLMKNPAGRNYGLTYQNCYILDAAEQKITGFNENGVSNDWAEDLAAYGPYKGKEITNVKLDNYTIICPTPSHPYVITKSWIYMQVVPTAATMLKSYIYPIGEDGYIAEMPIAMGSATISEEGEIFPIFKYNALDEDGDELEEPIIIDSSVAITIEGFQDNELIQEIWVPSGFYPFSYSAYSAGNYDLCKDSSLFFQLSFDADGEPATYITSNYGLYYYDQASSADMLTSLTYALLMTDAVFNYIDTFDGETQQWIDTVTFPVEGGSSSILLDTYYENIPKLVEDGLYEIEAPEWIEYEVKNVKMLDSESQEIDVPFVYLKAAAASEGREGDIIIKGYGAEASVHVSQGEVGAVGTISTAGQEQFYDLAGRKVANPEKGVYIKVNGNKAEKVIF